jgi:hypothetical protein
MTSLKKRRGNHEALFLPVYIGCRGRRAGYRLVADGLGKTGNHHSGRDPGDHEPFLPDLLLPQHEED